MLKKQQIGQIVAIFIWFHVKMQVHFNISFVGKGFYLHEYSDKEM